MIRPYVGQKNHILVIRRDGKGWFGEVTTMTADYIELTNGNQRQIIELFGNQSQYAVVKGPDVPSYGVGAPKLPL